MTSSQVPHSSSANSSSHRGVLIEGHAERYIERPPTELVRQRARTGEFVGSFIGSSDR